jgi:hypothetical protein
MAGMLRALQHDLAKAALADAPRERRKLQGVKSFHGTHRRGGPL